MFNESYGSRIINNSQFNNTQVMEEFVNNLFFETDNDLEYIAACECGDFRGNYYEGMTCPHCGTVVSSKFTTALSNINWMEIPPNMPKVLHPVFFLIFKEWLGKTQSTKHNRSKKVPVIQAILNPDDPLPDNLKAIIPKQGQTYFNENFDEIMKFFINKYRPTKTNRWNSHIEYLLHKYKDSLFTKKLPILHPSLHPLSKEGKTKTVDVTAGMILPAIMDLSVAGYSSRRSITSNKYIDRTIWKTYTKYIEYIESIIVKKLGDKFAHLRRHNTGSRVHFSARSVIVPIVKRHMGDEIHIPWKIIVNSMKHEIINVLVNRRGYSPNDAIAKHVKSLVIYDQEIYDILMELKSECPYKGIPVLIGRNPTLIHGAIQLCYITKFKQDVADATIGLSPRSCCAPNADFDGDEMYLIFIKEMGMVARFMNLHPMETMFSKNTLEVSSMVSMTNQSFVHWNGFLATARDVPETTRFELTTV